MRASCDLRSCRETTWTSVFGDLRDALLGKPKPCGGVSFRAPSATAEITVLCLSCVERTQVSSVSFASRLVQLRRFPSSTPATAPPLKDVSLFLPLRVNTADRSARRLVAPFSCIAGRSLIAEQQGDSFDGTCILCGLTFELSGSQRQGARPGLWRM